MKNTPSRTSPKRSTRACLCKDKNTYSRKCCDGSIWAQGVGISLDTQPPQNYTIEWNQSVLDFQNYTSASFHIGNGQAQSYYYYTIEDDLGSVVIGSGNMGNNTELDVLVDISTLSDGTLTLSAYLADPFEGVTIVKEIQKIVKTSEYVYTLAARVDVLENEECLYVALTELSNIEING